MKTCESGGHHLTYPYPPLPSPALSLSPPLPVGAKPNTIISPRSSYHGTGRKANTLGRSFRGSIIGRWSVLKKKAIKDLLGCWKGREGAKCGNDVKSVGGGHRECGRGRRWEREGKGRRANGYDCISERLRTESPGKTLQKAAFPSGGRNNSQLELNEGRASLWTAYSQPPLPPSPSPPAASPLRHAEKNQAVTRANYSYFLLNILRNFEFQWNNEGDCLSDFLDGRGRHWANDKKRKEEKGERVAYFCRGRAGRP